MIHFLMNLNHFTVFIHSIKHSFSLYLTIVNLILISGLIIGLVTWKIWRIIAKTIPQPWIRQTLLENKKIQYSFTRFRHHKKQFHLSLAIKDENENYQELKHDSHSLVTIWSFLSLGIFLIQENQWNDLNTTWNLFKHDNNWSLSDRVKS